MDHTEITDGLDSTAKRSRTATRRRLIASAERVFAERGLRGASIAQLCAAAGFSRGAFYSNFSTKEELAIAIYTQHIDQIVGVLEDEVAWKLRDGAPIRLIITDVLDAVAGVSENSVWHSFRLEMHLVAVRDPQLRDAVEAQHQRLIEAGANALRQAQDSGARLRLSSDVMARTLVALRDGELMFHRSLALSQQQSLLEAALSVLLELPETEQGAAERDEDVEAGDRPGG